MASALVARVAAGAPASRLPVQLARLRWRGGAQPLRGAHGGGADSTTPAAVATTQRGTTPPGATTVVIGGLTVERDGAADGSRVPAGYLTQAALAFGPLFGPAQLGVVPRVHDDAFGAPDAVTLGHLRWLLQKDALGQDMWLVGDPGPARRRLVLTYAELVGREVEGVTISRDTTEADIKQMRELQGGASQFVDGAPVRAAVAGRLLLLDGIERAERNVMPLLNNLLENREMALEDGRFLVSPSRWAALLAKAGPDAAAAAAALAADGLVPVHPRFRVVALALSVPPFPGRSIDPPLRSRFVARYVAPPSEDQIAAAVSLAAGAGAPVRDVNRLAAFAGMVAHMNEAATSAAVEEAAAAAAAAEKAGGAAAGAGLRRPGGGGSGMSALLGAKALLPPFPATALTAAATALRQDGGASAGHAGAVLQTLYPYWFMPAWRSEGGARRAIADASHRPHPARITAPGGRRSGATAPTMPATGGTGWSPTDALAARLKSSLASALSSSGLLPPALLPAPPSGLAPRTTAVDAATGLLLTPGLRRLMDGIHRSLAAGRDVLIVGPRGCGKSAVASAVGRALAGGRRPTLFSLYADMTTRDLLQYRGTAPPDAAAAGTTSVWHHSALVAGALAGEVVLLDGVERVPGETLAVLSRLAVDREVDLPDGSRAVSAAAADLIDARCAATAPPPGGRAVVRRIGASFRMIALAATDDLDGWTAGAAALDGVAGAAGGRLVAAATAATAPLPPPLPPWLHPEVVPMFDVHVFPAADAPDVAAILEATAPLPPLAAASHTRLAAWRACLASVAAVADTLRHLAAAEFADDPPTAALARLTLRQQQRLARTATASCVRAWTEDQAAAPSDGLPRAAAAAVSAELWDALALPVWPREAADKLVRTLTPLGFLSPSDATAATAATVEGGGAALTMTYRDVAGGGRELVIGGVAVPVATPAAPQLVPRTRFHAIPRHVAHLRDIAADLAAGERHLLLIGGQGVGKNRLIDALLQATHREREYQQLHRDSTVASLTLTPTLKRLGPQDVRVVWEDSALMRAARHGRVLVLDEVDKAPTEVTAVLKGLVQDGELRLADGRRLLRCDSSGSGSRVAAADDVIPIHPDFTVVALANRPGWPFLGNSVLPLAAAFACHWIGHPDAGSEVQLLSAYAPHVAPPVLRALVSAFGELRAANEAGDLTYPYSTRELVAVVRHLEAYPSDTVAAALEGVSAFEAYDAVARRAVAVILARHGIELPAGAGVVGMRDGAALTAAAEDEAGGDGSIGGGGGSDGNRVLRLRPAVVALSRSHLPPTPTSPPSAPRRALHTTTAAAAAGGATHVPLATRRWYPDNDLLRVYRGLPTGCAYAEVSPRATVFSEHKAAVTLSTLDAYSTVAPARLAASTALPAATSGHTHLYVLTAPPTVQLLCLSPLHATTLPEGPSVADAEGRYPDLHTTVFDAGSAARLPWAIGGLASMPAWQRAPVGSAPLSGMAAALASAMNVRPPSTRRSGGDDTPPPPPPPGGRGRVAAPPHARRGGGGPPPPAPPPAVTQRDCRTAGSPAAFHYGGAAA